MEQPKRTGRLDVNIAFFLRTSKILHEVHLYVDISSTTNHHGNVVFAAVGS